MTPCASSNPYPSGHTSTRSREATVAVVGHGPGRSRRCHRTDRRSRRPVRRERRRTALPAQRPRAGCSQMFCRSGLPFTAKSVTGRDRTDVYKPLICTAEALDALSGRPTGSRRPVDVRTELLPLLFAEMYARYYAQVAFQRGHGADGAAVRERLRAAWADGRFDQELARLAARFGSFDAEGLFFGHQPSYDCSEDYERSSTSRSPTTCARPRCPTAPARSSRPPRCSGSSGIRCVRWSSRAACRLTPTSTSMPTSAAGSTAWSRVRRRCARASCSP